MDISRTESVPQFWDEHRDTPFFRVACRVFSAEFLYGAGVLLACNDLDAETSVAAPPLNPAHGRDVSVTDVRAGATNA